MIRSLWRSLRSRQLELTDVCVGVTSDAAAGPDFGFIQSVERVSDGVYTLTFWEESQRDLEPTKLVMKTDGHVGHVSAVTKSSITVETQEVSSGNNSDADFLLTFVWHKHPRVY